MLKTLLKVHSLCRESSNEAHLFKHNFSAHKLIGLIYETSDTQLEPPFFGNLGETERSSSKFVDGKMGRNRRKESRREEMTGYHDSQSRRLKT